MIDESFPDYALWLQLANDPSQSEQAREHYRGQMQNYLQGKMREAFKLASAQTRSAEGEAPYAP